MAEASSFDESNRVLDKPPGMSCDECDPLSVYAGKMGTHPVVVSCWKLTKEELEEVVRTGRIWLTVFGNSMPPVNVSGNKPFEEV